MKIYTSTLLSDWINLVIAQFPLQVLTCPIMKIIIYPAKSPKFFSYRMYFLLNLNRNQL